MEREYIYRVESNAGKWMDYIQQQKKGCWSIKEEVDLEKVKEGMKIFIGRHDFTQFTSVKRISVSFSRMIIIPSTLFMFNNIRAKTNQRSRR